jgi:hypothetical protein
LRAEVDVSSLDFRTARDLASREVGTHFRGRSLAAYTIDLFGGHALRALIFGALADLLGLVQALLIAAGSAAVAAAGISGIALSGGSLFPAACSGRIAEGTVSPPRTHRRRQISASPRPR